MTIRFANWRTCRTSRRSSKWGKQKALSLYYKDPIQIRKKSRSDFHTQVFSDGWSVGILILYFSCKWLKTKNRHPKLNHLWWHACCLIHRQLDMSFNMLRKVEGLEQMTKLKKLFLLHNKIGSIANLEHLTGLDMLELGSNRIRVRHKEAPGQWDMRNECYT